MEKEIDFVERLNREPTKHSTPCIITMRKDYKNRKLQTECLLSEFEKDYVDCVYVYFCLKVVRGVRYPRMHICLHEDIHHLDSEVKLSEKSFSKFKVAFQHCVDCMAKQLTARLKVLSSLCECSDTSQCNCVYDENSKEELEEDNNDLNNQVFVPCIEVLPPKNKIHVSTSCFVVDKNQNILCCRRVKCEERSAGWGNPGRSQVEFGDIRKVVINNLLEDIGLEITELENINGEATYAYDRDKLSVEPCYMYESVRDINNEEYLTINFHEIVIYFLIQLGVSKDKVNLQITGNLIDNVVWLNPSELNTILLKEESENCTTGFSVKNKKNHRERIMYSQLEPFYPNNLTGEGIIKDDYYAYLYLIKNIDTLCPIHI